MGSLPINQSRLRLAYSFDLAQYPFSVLLYYSNPLDTTCRKNVKNHAENALSLSQINGDDSHIFDHHDHLEVLFKHEQDTTLFKAATEQDDPISLNYFTGFKKTTNKRLLRSKRSLELKIRGTPLEQRISLYIDFSEKVVIVDAATGFDFLMLRHIDQKIFSSKDMHDIYQRKFSLTNR
jgi:hypothetical protein